MCRPTLGDLRRAVLGGPPMTWTAWRHILPGRAPAREPDPFGSARTGSLPSRVRLPQEATLSEVTASCHHNFPNYRQDKSFESMAFAISSADLTNGPIYASEDL